MRASSTTRCALALIVVLGAACGGGEAESEGTAAARGCAAEFQQPFSDVAAYPVFVSSDLAVGPNRFLVGLRDQNDAPVGSPKVEMHVDFFDLEPCSDQPVASRDMEFLWTIKPVVGLFKTEMRFDSPGLWGAEVTIEGDGMSETVKGSFDVAEESRTPGIGERPPASETPTAVDVETLGAISTD